MPLGEAGKGFASRRGTAFDHYSFPFLCPAVRWLQWLWLSSLKLTGQTSSCHEPRQSLELLSHPFPKRSKAFLSNKNPYPAFFQGSQKLVWQCICSPLRHNGRWEEPVPTCKYMAESCRGRNALWPWRRDDRAAVASPALLPTQQVCGAGPGRDPGTPPGSAFLHPESKSRACLTILNGTSYFMFPSKLSSRREYFRICAGVTNLSLL